MLLLGFEIGLGKVLVVRIEFISIRHNLMMFLSLFPVVSSIRGNNPFLTSEVRMLVYHRDLF